VSSVVADGSWVVLSEAVGSVMRKLDATAAKKNKAQVGRKVAKAFGRPRRPALGQAHLARDMHVTDGFTCQGIAS
jgi:hypothetical protein